MVPRNFAFPSFASRYSGRMRWGDARLLTSDWRWLPHPPAKATHQRLALRLLVTGIRITERSARVFLRYSDVAPAGWRTEGCHRPGPNCVSEMPAYYRVAM